jgi:CubicO group peptidase (beta-lactamase class C family)
MSKLLKCRLTVSRGNIFLVALIVLALRGGGLPAAAQSITFDTEAGTVTHTYRELRPSRVRARALFPRFEGARVELNDEVFRKLMRRVRETHSDAFLLLQDGRVVYEYASERGREPIEVMSVSKALVNVGFGRLVELGLLENLDTPVHQYFPEWRQGKKRGITIRQLLSHSSGLEASPSAFELYQQRDMVQFALSSEIQDDPGTKFFYNNEAVNLLPAIAERVTGRKFDEFMTDEVFGPLGIENLYWMRDEAGNPHAMAGVKMQAADLARIGQLMLDGGVVEGDRLLPADWVSKSVQAVDVELHPRVGMLWFVLTSAVEGVEDGEASTPIGFQANGFRGQFLAVIPSKSLVAVRLIDSESHQSGEDDFGDFFSLLRALISDGPSE